MAPLTQSPLLAQEFRPDPDIHSGPSISGAPGGGGDSPTPSAYQSIQVQATLQASLRGTSPDVGTEALGEAGPSSQETTQGGQLLPGQGETPGQPPPGAFLGPTQALQSDLIRNFMGGLSQRSMEELSKFRDAFERQRVTVESNIARLRQGLGFQAPKEAIENILRDRRKYELLSDAVGSEIARREMR